jgi:hypothetical protein
LHFSHSATIGNVITTTDTHNPLPFSSSFKDLIIFVTVNAENNLQGHEHHKLIHVKEATTSTPRIASNNIMVTSAATRSR